MAILHHKLDQFEWFPEENLLIHIAPDAHNMHFDIVTIEGKYESVNFYRCSHQDYGDNIVPQLNKLGLTGYDPRYGKMLTWAYVSHQTFDGEHIYVLLRTVDKKANA